MEEADRRRILPRTQIIINNRRALIWRDVLEARQKFVPTPEPPEIIAGRHRDDLVALMAEILATLEQMDAHTDDTAPGRKAGR
jgi:hypothetical protein